MNDTTNPNRRKDDARPAVALQWGDRPDHWTLLLTGPTTGLIGPLGSTWPNQPGDLERVDVCVRRSSRPVAVYRTGGEGAATWHQFYPLVDTGQEPLRDGEYLYREGAPTKLENIEQYRLQMAAIGTAALGYWKLGDSISPDYDTQVLRDVAALYGKYDELHRFRAQVLRMVRLLKDREWAEDLDATGDALDLQAEISKLVASHSAVLESAAEKLDSMNDSAGDSAAYDNRDITCCENERMMTLTRAAEAVRGLGYKAAPDAVDLHAQNRAAAETVAFSPPAMVRDSLYQDYAVPKTEGGQE